MINTKNLKNIKLNPAAVSGVFKAPSSKSIAHRTLICAALASGGLSHIYGIDMSDDITATIGALRTMGCNIDVLQDKISVNKGETLSDNITVNCKESGSTLRFLIPVVAALGINATFIGEGRLPERPIQLYQEIFADKGVSVALQDEMLPMTVSGQLMPGKFYIPGDITSQFITGLLFALPLLNGDSEIILTSPLESAPYVDMTINVLKVFGIGIHQTNSGYYINGSQSYLSAAFIVEGDFSQAAFVAAAAAINGEAAIRRLNSFSSQGDYKIIELLGAFGAKVFFDGNVLQASKGELRGGIKIDARNIPDLVPVLAVVAAYAEGETVIYNAKRLRFKESDRLHAVCEMLTAIGADAKETDDGLIIRGKEKLKGGNVKSYNDHRIAMSAAVASLRTENGITIDDMSCINKSYPQFLDDFLMLTKN